MIVLSILCLLGALIGLALEYRDWRRARGRRRGPVVAVAAPLRFEVVFPPIAARRFDRIEDANDHAAKCRKAGVQCLVQVAGGP